MPASRSRTERWQDCLWNIYERGGGLEIAVGHTPAASSPSSPAADPAQDADDQPEQHPDLVWRVRVLNLTEDEIVLEQPGTLGKPFVIEAGTPLLCAMAVGQNKWMFHARALGSLPGRGPAARPALRVSMPEKVERCRRRTHERISTATLSYPPVRCSPLLDPSSAATAQLACRVAHERAASGDHSPSQVRPEIGPGLTATLVNIGGGGVGLRFDREQAGAVDSSRLYWVEINLGEALPAPVHVAARIAHTHIDSSQNLYAGLAFEFGLDAPHRSFIISAIGAAFARSIAQARAA